MAEQWMFLRSPITLGYMETSVEEPTLLHTPGGWLAVAKRDKGTPQIGVMGDTEEEARRAFQESRAFWLALRGAPEIQAGTEGSVGD